MESLDVWFRTTGGDHLQSLVLLKVLPPAAEQDEIMPFGSPSQPRHGYAN